MSFPARRRLCRGRALCALVAAACLLTSGAAAREVTLSVGKLEAPGVTARDVRVNLTGEQLRAITMSAGRVAAAGQEWRNAKLDCPDLELTAQRIACARATLMAREKIPLAFAYRSGPRELEVEAKPGGDEIWRVTGRFGPGAPTINARLERARLDRLAPWLPKDLPKITGGHAGGTLAWRGDALHAQLAIAGFGFADASGLHAAEKIGGTVEFQAREQRGEWRWNADIAWKSGEVFWQPVFAAGKGQRLVIEGTTARGVTDVRQGTLDVPGIAAIDFTARWDHAKAALQALEARSGRVRLGALYQDLLKPLLQGTALADMRVEGDASFTAQSAGTRLRAFTVEMQGVSFEDRRRRFAVFGLSGRVPWQAEGSGTAQIAWKGAEILKVPIGAATVPMQIQANRVEIETVRVPVLDGALTLRDFAAGMAKDGWRWRFNGELAPISMVRLTQTLGIPVMHGSLGGRIPEVRYRGREISMDGALVLDMFDGTVTASHMRLLDPFGRAPRLHANLEMKNLDLDLLTRTFDFGTITGRIDARVRGLELVDWQPVRFDARIESSPGNYPRRISQRAVQNISALGGAGAAAAIQRSLLRFFDTFGYQKLGLSCRLENGVCEMGGIERAPRGYVIVKGGGIPAISVIGYNRAVNWRELVERLKRITQDNVTPIVK